MADPVPETDILEWSHLVSKIARRLLPAAERAGLDRDDLAQEGFLAFLREASKFDAGAGVSRKSFLAFLIEKRMIDAIRAYSPVGRHLQEVVSGKRQPKSYDPNSVASLRHPVALSLDSAFYDDEDGESILLCETVTDGRESPDAIAETTDMLEMMLGKMTPREQCVMRSLSAGLTMKETGRRMSIDESRVSQIRTRLRKRLVHFLPDKTG